MQNRSAPYAELCLLCTFIGPMFQLKQFRGRNYQTKGWLYLDVNKTQYK